MGIAALDLEVGLAASHKEAGGLVNPMKSLEIEIAPIHDVERAGLGEQLIEDMDLVHLAIADVEEGRNIAAQVEQRVQLDGGLGGTERRPRKYRQAQIDGGCIQCVDRVCQIDAKRFVPVKCSSHAHQALSIIGVDAPVAHCVGMGQGIARNHRSNSEMVELATLRSQTSLDIAQALAIGQLREGHGEELIQTGEGFDLALALITGDTSPKGGQRQMLHHLRKHQLALVHSLSSRSCPSQGRRTRLGSSNRDQENSAFIIFQSMTYTAQHYKRWDTTVITCLFRIQVSPCGGPSSVFRSTFLQAASLPSY